MPLKNFSTTIPEEPMVKGQMELFNIEADMEPIVVRSDASNTIRWFRGPNFAHVQYPADIDSAVHTYSAKCRADISRAATIGFTSIFDVTGEMVSYRNLSSELSELNESLNEIYSCYPKVNVNIWQDVGDAMRYAFNQYDRCFSNMGTTTTL